MSPYAEKVRLGLGLRGHRVALDADPDRHAQAGPHRAHGRLPPRADVPTRRAELYCDSKTILRTLERSHPDSNLFPTRDEATIWGLSR
ncbi:MAG: hypothetical protein ACE1Z7_04095 [Woeseiaceae bacterium]